MTRDHPISQTEVDHVQALCDIWREWSNAAGYLTAVATIAGQALARDVRDTSDEPAVLQDVEQFFRTALRASYHQAMHDREDGPCRNFPSGRASRFTAHGSTSPRP